MSLGGSCRAAVVRLLIGAAVVAPCALSAPRVLAQSAADKATARQLATEGIKLFSAGKYEEALDSLQRAQDLYDAPVHLLYIARTQVKLGKLVEAAESYRRLQRVQLEPGAPRAFRDAIVSAQQEFPTLEPRVPSLRLDVEPAKLAGLEIRIDAEPVPAAALRVNRPANPGERKIEMWAPGYQKAEQTVTLAEGETKSVKLTLVPGEGPPPGGVTAGGSTAGVGPGGAGDQGAIAPEEPSAPPSNIGFMVGLRVGGAIPSGTAYTAADGSDVPMSDNFEPGGGGELHGGVRFLKYFTGILVFEAYSLKPGPVLDNIGTPSGSQEIEVSNTTFATGFGLGVLAGTERGRFGGFGELVLLPVHTFTADRERTSASGSCKGSATFSGTALRVGGGVSIPLTPFLNLAPFINATFGRFSDVTIDQDCAAAENLFPDTAIAEQATHQMFVLGVGGDFLFGKDYVPK
jgi:hypothetical protein